MIDHIIDKEKWQSLPLIEQLSNIGSEVGRTFAAKRRGNKEAMEGAFYRGLDLIDMTAEKLAKEKSPRLKELLRAREIFASLEDETIEKYFMDYALAARYQKMKEQEKAEKLK